MKVAVVTGASKGIGEGVIRSLLRDDWMVYGLSRTKPAFEDDRFRWIKCDLQLPEEIGTSLSQITEPVDFLLSNAGVAFEEPATAVTQDSFARMYSVNVLAPMLMVAALKEQITKATIVSVSSVSDRIVEKDFVLYGSSKAANTRFFNTLAAELTDAKVYVLLPDYVDTPMLRKLQGTKSFDWSQTLQVEDVAKLTLDLAAGRQRVESGSNIIVINEQMRKDLEPTEKLYGYNADTGELTKL
jgi:NAD(P)-dependent dehydrogenase (short-subunit alcohol dehydrogenase family)